MTFCRELSPLVGRSAFWRLADTSSHAEVNRFLAREFD